MKLSTFRAFLCILCSVALVSYVTAGPGASGDHGQSSNAPANGNAFGHDNPGQQGQSGSDGTRGNSQDNAGKSGNAFGRDTADNAGFNGSSHQNSAAMGRESVTDTGDRGFGESASSEKSESNSSDKTFKASLMDTGLKASESPSSHGPSGTPPGNHYGWEKGKHNPHKSSPSPSASASASASVSPSASASASAAGTPTPSGSP